MRVPTVGDAVIYHDPKGNAHNALVNVVWNENGLINLIYVSSDESRKDTYGRQMERQTSLSHKSSTYVHGFYWRWPDEEPNPYTPPLQD